ncbi:uncharacterized protein PHALS_00509 [Plasmopara halstedii]|uniref:Uncharacterized protein n=1 Tax=Plasmopara halstedii TaxID=4781 RepID=A0A0N7L3L2_PLAHL|nr:uncharacterized protein PHALS_00509 [Plasmopara halstedii]CEG36187.1 hypothetical protein PHALS_00509 [Plasmopara halstedii]|eukprot:XP_024572556.1 hypothetical protein PHALS_00509 [Plasmopara halstedii]
MWNDGSTTADTVLALLSSNATAPVKVVVQFSNLTNATSINGAWIGSNNDLHFLTNNSRKCTVTAGGRFGIGTATPSAFLHIQGSVSFADISGTGGQQYNINSNTWTNLGTGALSLPISALFSSLILVGSSVYSISDRRLKKDIKTIDLVIDRYHTLNPVCSGGTKGMC